MYSNMDNTGRIGAFLGVVLVIAILGFMLVGSEMLNPQTMYCL